MDFPKRKSPRLPFYDYSAPGAYFITICTQEKRNLLSKVVGGGALDAPKIELSPLGQLVEKNILSGNRIEGIRVDKYVIMPNHVHLILIIDGDQEDHTKANALIPHWVSTFKRFCHQSANSKFFQRSFHDHVIRNEQDYLRIWQYIDNNPASWQTDCFFED